MNKNYVFYAHRYAAIALIAVCLITIEGIRSTALSAPNIAVRRITSDGASKCGITLSGGGTTVSWLEVLQ